MGAQYILALIFITFICFVMLLALICCCFAGREDNNDHKLDDDYDDDDSNLSILTFQSFDEDLLVLPQLVSNIQLESKSDNSSIRIDICDGDSSSHPDLKVMVEELHSILEPDDAQK